MCIRILGYRKLLGRFFENSGSDIRKFRKNKKQATPHLFRTFWKRWNRCRKLKTPLEWSDPLFLFDIPRVFESFWNISATQNDTKTRGMSNENSGSDHSRVVFSFRHRFQRFQRVRKRWGVACFLVFPNFRMSDPLFSKNRPSNLRYPRILIHICLNAPLKISDWLSRSS